jgi:hypothetical protein
VRTHRADGNRLSPTKTPGALIGHFSNRQFGQSLARLTVPAQRPDQSDRGQPGLCGCGCGAAVSAPRKFANQEHYSASIAVVVTLIIYAALHHGEFPWIFGG